MKTLGTILSQRVHQTSNFKSVNSAMVVGEAQKSIRKVVGDNIGKYAKVVYFKDGMLAIICLSSVVSQEIKLNEVSLINYINKKLGTEKVRKIRYLA